MKSPPKIQPPPRLRETILEKHLRVGDTITHTRCMGCVEEHIYTRRDGRWYCGKPTRDTLRLGGDRGEVNDISPGNITHVNRVPVLELPFVLNPRRAKKG